MMFAIFLEYGLAWCCNTLLGVSLEALKEYNYTPYNPYADLLRSIINYTPYSLYLAR